MTRNPRIASVTGFVIPLLLMGAVTFVAFDKTAQKRPSFAVAKREVPLLYVHAHPATTTTTTTLPPTTTTKPHVRNYTPVTTPPTGDIWERLRMCESHGNYSDNTGNSYYGAYQFSAGTWNSMGTAYARADLAPPDEQDDAAKRLQVRGGWQQWPACSRTIGVR